MTQWRLWIGIVLILHGIGHALGIIALSSLGSESWNARSWLFDDSPARVISVVMWVACIVTFVVAGLALLDHHQRGIEERREGEHIVAGQHRRHVAVLLDEGAAVDLVLVGDLHQLAFQRHQPAVDAVELVDKRLDPVVVQVQFVHLLDDGVAQLLVLSLLRRAELRVVAERRADAGLLHRVQFLVGLGDLAQRLQDMGLERRLHGREREVGLLLLGLGLSQIPALGAGSRADPPPEIKQRQRSSAPSESTICKISSHPLTPSSVGSLTPAGLEVLTGLEEGDRLVTAGISQIEDGDTVRLAVEDEG